MPEVLIGRGRTGRVYKIDGNPPLVRKELDPSYVARVWNWFFYSSPHLLDTTAGHEYSEQKRNLASPLSRYMSDEVEIVDAIGPAHNGFTASFIDGRKLTKNERRKLYPVIRRFEEEFDYIGMPTLGFSQRRNPFSDSNWTLGFDGKIHIWDYEQSVPMPDARGNMGYDTIYFDDVGKFIKENKQGIANKFGTEEARFLEEAFEMAREYHAQLDLRPRKIKKFDAITRALSRREMDKAVERLYDKGKITRDELEDYRSGTGELVRLAAMNLFVHCVIGLATPPWILTPVSAALRPAWTLANKYRYWRNGDNDKRRIHGWRVAAMSALPLPFPANGISNGAYISSIMEINPYLGLAMADNMIREWYEMDLEEAMRKLGSNRFVKPFVKAYYWGDGMLPENPHLFLGPNTKKAHDILLSYLIDGAKR